MARQMHPNSLANLDPAKRSKDKRRCNVTLLPETVQWLRSTGNASKAIDRLVAFAREQERLGRSILIQPSEEI